MDKADVLVSVDGVSKKFCRSLKKSLWYGIQDIVRDINPFAQSTVAYRGPSQQLPSLDSSQKASGNSSPSILRDDEFWAVGDASFTLRRGECLGLIGHNGAGKTTLLKMLNGLIKPDKGRIEMRGRVGALIALGAGFNPILTGRENIYVNGSVLGMSKAEIDSEIDAIIDFAEIRDFIDAPVQSYSSGMAVRLGFAIAVKSRPDILLLDEVLAVGDIGFQAKCFNTLAEFRKQGTAFILVSHNLHQISRYCDHLLYLNRGRVSHIGDVDTGIRLFNADMTPDSKGNESAVTDWSAVCGSGKVVLRGARFLDSSNQPINQIHPGDAFALQIDFECPGGKVDDAMLDVIIRDRGEMLFQGANENYGAPFGTLPRQGNFLIKFDHAPFNGSEIQFFFSILSSKTAEIYDWKRHVRLKIANNPKLTGRLALAARWSVTNGAECPTFS